MALPETFPTQAKHQRCAKHKGISRSKARCDEAQGSAGKHTTNACGAKSRGKKGSCAVNYNNSYLALFGLGHDDTHNNKSAPSTNKIFN